MAPSRGTLVAGAIGAGLVGLLLLQGSPDRHSPLDPQSDEPDGTSALVALLEQLGTHVELSVGLPGAADDVALVLEDHLDEEQTTDVLAWARSGGTLVVTDPESSLAPGVFPVPAEGDGPVRRGICTVDALDDVEEVHAGFASRYDTGGASSSCLGSRDFAFVTVRGEGSGHVVAVGGPDFAINEHLDEADNAVLAAALLARGPGSTVRFVEAPLPAGGGDKSLADLVSDSVRRFGLQLGIAFLLYAAWRAVRLGRPVREPQPVEIAGSELVGAAGRLLERGRSAGPSAEVLRARLRRSVGARLGLPPSAPDATLAEVIVDRSGADPEVVRLAVGHQPVTSDDELVEVARAVATVHEEVLR
ncbi:MAG: DUF4350 domain-containing protein [Acidimicrobiales bacterium]